MTTASEIIEHIQSEFPASPQGWYYDAMRKENLMPSKGSWIRLNEASAKRQLKALGYRTEADRTEPVSPLDAALNALQLNAAVDYAGSLAGYRAGPYEMQGHSILVTRSPRIIDPVPGECPTIQFLFESLLRDERFRQLEMFYSWLKIYCEALRNGVPRTGQALVFVGAKDCGKSLAQNLLTEVMGGRSAKPYQFATGGTAFNADLFEAEHLQIEDEAPSTDMRSRRIFGSFMKGIAANSVHRIHGKCKDGLTLEPHWRLTVSVNDDPEHLPVLPPLDESLSDKVLIFKCSPPLHPFNSGTAEARIVYWKMLLAEIPAFVDFLMNFQIPEELVHHRFGINAFIHPEIKSALDTLSDEHRLLNFIDMSNLMNGSNSWEGTAEALEVFLRTSNDVRFEIGRLLSWPRACGVFLSRLAQSTPERVQALPRKDNRHYWRISR